jgi:hypothetical protein
MSTKIVASLCIAAVVAYACGPRSGSTETPTRARAASTQSVASSFDVKVGRHVKFALRVTNHGAKRIELNFPSGQTHDVVVLDTKGREVWRWSAGRMFTQNLQNKTLASNETITVEEEWAPTSRDGTFTAVMSLNSTNHPVEQRVEFALQ